MKQTPTAQPASQNGVGSRPGLPIEAARQLHAAGSDAGKTVRL